MAIRILRNETGNCINFVGSTQPAYWNGCLSARVNEEDSNRVDVINDIRTTDVENPVFEFYAVDFTEFRDAENNSFATAQAAADYITANGNVLGGATGPVQATVDTAIDYQRDATNTTILSDDGRNAPVNAIKASLGPNDLIQIAENALGEDSAILYQGLYPQNITIAGVSQGTNAAAVVNALNALFTVQPLGSGGDTGLPTYPTSDAVSVTTTKQEGVDPVGGAIYSTGSDTSSGHGARVWTTGTDYIDELGEYFTVRVQNHGRFIIGVYDLDDSTQVAALSNNTGNGHSGLMWGNAFYDYGSYIAPWTMYGANSSYQIAEGWSSSDQTKLFRYNTALQEDILDGTGALLKIGFTSEGRIAVSYYDIGRTNDWIETARTGYVVPEGRYGLVVKLWDQTVALQEEPKIYKQEETAPSLTWRYIESPDGAFYYPLFATREEADYVSQNANALFGGSYVDDIDTNVEGYYSHSHIFPDDPTNTVWYMPDNYMFHSQSSAPAVTVDTPYAGIATEADNLHGPSVLNIQDFTYTENQSVNQQIIPQDDASTIQNTPAFEAALALVGLTYNSLTKSIEGTTSYVPEDTSATITLIRENVYGQTTDEFVINITDNASLGNLAGFTETAGNMVQPNRIILTHDALLQYDTTLSQGEELTYSFASGDNPPTIGILSTLGQTNLNAFDPATDILGASSTYNYAETNKWALRFVTFGGYIGGNTTKHNLVGWTDNTAITGTNENVGAEIKLEYSSVDGLIRLYRNEVLMATSASSFTGAQTITFAAFDDQDQSNVYIPSNLAFVNSSYGTTQPPSGFVNPLLAGQMSTSTLLGEGPDEDAAARLSTDLKINHRYIFPQSWVEANVLPHAASEDGNEAFIGVADQPADWVDVGEDDFDAFFKIAGTSSASSYTSTINVDGQAVNNITINSLTDSFYDYALEWDGTNLHVIACNIGDINTQPGISGGGAFSRTKTFSTYDQSGDLPVVVAVDSGGQVNLTTSGLSQIRIPFGINDILVGEASNGHGRYAVQPAASVFDSAPSGHAPSEMTYNGVTTLNAGTTYRFIFHPSMEADDTIEFRLASDNTTVYTTGVTTFGSGDPDFTSAYKGIEFAVPADAPPLTLYYYNGFATSYDLGNAIAISGSTYVTPVTGITLEGPSANQTGTNVMDAGEHGWISLNEQLSAGERLVLDNAFFADFLAEAQGTNNIFAIGLKGDNWANTTEINSNGAGAAVQNSETFKGNTYIIGIWGSSGSGVTMWICNRGILSNSMYMNSSSLFPTACAFLEISSSGNNIRGGFGRNNSTGNITAGDESSVAYADWNAYKGQTGDQGYGITSLDVVMSFWTFGGGDIDGNLIDWTGLSEVSIPTPAATLTTNWTKALDFSGSSERTKMTVSSSTYGVLRMGDLGVTTAAGTSGNTSNDSNARPWATTIVFSSDNNASNQHIWNQGEGAGSTDDNIYLRVDSSRNLYFGWGRTGALNECSLGTLASGAGNWYGIYVAHTGERLSGANASAANLADCFDIRSVNLSTGVVGSNMSTSSNWTNTGGRMDRVIIGDLTIGGRGSNRNFHGKVASMVITTLKRNQIMPDNTEISMMVRDPQQWVDDYRVGNTYRYAPYSYNNSNFQRGNFGPIASTQVWLMGDGNSDAYAKIRNQVWDADQNYTTMDMVSMVSNDIQTVSISGLT